MPPALPEFFERYPVSPDELIGQAVALTTAGDGAAGIATSVQGEVDRALTSVEGDLDGPLGQAPRLALATAGQLEGGARFAAGCLSFFAQGIITYNAGIDALNQQLWQAIEANPLLPADEQKSGSEFLTPELLQQQQALDLELDTRADEVAAMLDRGPNPTDEAALAAAGALPAPVANDPAWHAIGQRPNAEAVLAGTADPTTAAQFWASLSVAERTALIRDRPDLVGRINGFPVGARDEANRILLQHDIDHLSQKQASCTITEAEQRQLANAQATQQALTDAGAGTDPVTGDPMTAQLMIYEPTAFGGDGRGAVSVGDAETADNVAFVVPGIRTEMTSLPRYTEDGRNLYDQARASAPGESTAVVVWIGYDAPRLEAEDLALDPGVPYGATLYGASEETVTEGAADQGGQLLAYDFAGFEASRGSDNANTTVIGHSYGSTTVAYAAADHGMRPDQVVLIGSPGAGPADTASDLNLIMPGSVYVGATGSDPVTYLGNQGTLSRGEVGLGYDPAEVEFGAIRFAAEVPGQAGYEIADHSAYLSPGSESLTNIAGITTGQGPVTVVDPRDDVWWDVEIGYPHPDSEFFREPAP